MIHHGYGRHHDPPWTTIPITTPHISSFRSHLQSCKAISTNPYEPLQTKIFQSTNKFTLPNGDTISTSFPSIEALSTYLSSITKTTCAKPNFVKSSLRNNHTHTNSNPISKISTITTSIDNITYSTASVTKNKSLVKKIISSDKSANPLIVDNIKKSSKNIIASTTKLVQNVNLPTKFPQFFRTLSDKSLDSPPAMMPSLPNYAQAIESLLTNIDITNVHVDLGRSLCLRLAALHHIPFDEWKKIHSIDLASIRTKLTQYQDHNIIAISTPATQTDIVTTYDPSI